MLTESYSKTLETLSPKHKKLISKASLAYYASEFIYLENGSKFHFKNHEYLHAIYADEHPYIVSEKATQMGITTWAFVRSIWGCTNLFPLGVMYFFPSLSDVSDFSRGRITPFLQYNNELKMIDSKDVDTVGMKRVGKSFIYFRGMKSAVGMKSVPADCLVFDEVDEADPYAKEMALKRISHSSFKWVMEFSNPTIENYGVNKSFQESDMRYWYIKCVHCNEWNNLEKEFPQCLRRIGSGQDSKVIRICKKCGGELNLNAQAEWVADYPTRTDKRGYHVSQLFSHYINPKVILDEFETSNNLENFYRLRIGTAYTSAQNKLSKQQILDLERAEMPLGLDDVTFVGIDQGSNIHGIVLKMLPGGRIGLQDIFEIKDFEAIDQKYKEFRTKNSVIDALPEQRKARELRMRNPDIVYMNYYNEAQKGSYKWDEENGIVQENRTESIDASNNLITGNKLVINKAIDPRLVEMFAEHCASIARIKETAENGSQRYVWTHVGPDHLRHALNYAYIAMNPYIEGDMQVPYEEAYEEEKELVGML